MRVEKRDGRLEDFNIEKIHDVLFWATHGIKGVTVSDIEIKIAPQIFDGITSVQIHEVLIQGCADMITEKTPNYQHVAANLLNYYLRKDVFGISDNMPPLLDVIKSNIESGVYDKVILENYTESEIKKFDNIIKHKPQYALMSGLLLYLLNIIIIISLCLELWHFVNYFFPDNILNGVF